MSAKKPKLKPFRNSPLSKRQLKATGLLDKKVATPNKVDLEKALLLIPLNEDFRRKVVENMSGRKMTVGRVFTDLDKIGGKNWDFRRCLPKIVEVILQNDEKLSQEAKNYVKIRLLFQQEMRVK